MEETIGFIIAVSTGFFAMANPIGNTPIFHSFVEALDSKMRKRIAFRAVTVSFVVVMMFTIFGKLIFKFFGITLPAFQITGGIIVFIIGYQRLHGRTSHVHHMTEKESNDYSEGEDLATYPLAVPILAGPGTIATAMSFAGQKVSLVYTAIVIAIYALLCLVTYFSWAYSSRLVRVLTPGITRIIIRLMGLIVAVIAVQLVIYGIKNAIEIYVK